MMNLRTKARSTPGNAEKKVELIAIDCNACRVGADQLSKLRSALSATNPRISSVARPPGPRSRYGVAISGSAANVSVVGTRTGTEMNSGTPRADINTASARSQRTSVVRDSVAAT
jgi:hypothetical protein